jgi:hypothetical protein
MLRFLLVSVCCRNVFVQGMDSTQEQKKQEAEPQENNSDGQVDIINREAPTCIKIEATNQVEVGVNVEGWRAVGEGLTGGEWTWLAGAEYKTNNGELRPLTTNNLVHLTTVKSV